MYKDKINKIVKKSQALSFFKMVWFKKKWRKLNAHNFTEAANCFDRKKVQVGNGTYGELRIFHFGNPNEKLTIGNYCSIAPNVSFILGGEHNYNKISTYPFSVMYGLNKFESITKGPIYIYDDVWIGYSSIIMSGVEIGQGAIVAAGALVNKNVPPYSIVGGVPAKVIGYRFDEKYISELLKINYGKLSEDDIVEKLETFNSLSFDMNTIRELVDTN